LLLVISPFIFEYQYTNFNKTLSVANIIRFTREDKYKFLFVEYVTCTIYGFNLCVKVEQTAAINIVKDMPDFTVEGWKIGKEIPTWVLGYDEWVNDVPIHPRYYPVNGNNESMHDKDTEVVEIVDDPDDTDSVVVDNACDNVDEAGDEDFEEHQYADGLKDNVTGDQDEEVNLSEKDDSDGDPKGKGTEVEGEEVNWSDDEDTQSALVASADPLYVAVGKWQNEAQGRPTNSGSRTISEYSNFF
jgi:hypothetical protein